MVESQFSRVYRRPIKQPYQLMESSDGLFELVLARALGTKTLNRMCLPADYTTDKLLDWNQKNPNTNASPWKKPTNIGDLSGKIGLTIINSGTSVVFHQINDYTQQSRVNPLELTTEYNWSHNKVNKKFSFEFFLDNDLEETNVTEIYDDDETFWNIYQSGTGSYGITISEETTEVKKGTSSLKMVIGAGSYTDVGVIHSYGTPQNWSNFEFICLWIYGVNSGATLRIRLEDSDLDWQYWDITDNFTGWKRLVLPLEKPDAEATGLLNLAAINQIRIFYYNITAGFTSYLDRTVIDVGQWAVVEVFVPDKLNTHIQNVKFSAWDGSAYQEFYTYDADDNNPTGTATWSNCKFLDGSSIETIYGTGNTYFDICLQGEREEVKSALRGKYSSNVTYSSYYGCKKRVIFLIKMPPDDGQDSSTTGISQIRLKIEILYWTNDKIEDTSENENNGVLYGALPVTGKYGQAIDFDGTDDYIEVEHSNSLNFEFDESFTIEIWIKINSLPSTEGQIIVKHDDGANWKGYQFFVVNDGTLRVRIIGSWFSETVSRNSSSTLTTNQWYHIVMVYDGSNNANGIKIYIDGADKSGSIEYNNSISISIKNTRPLRMGKRIDDQYALDGILDEVRIYNRALSQSEIQNNMNGNVTRTGLVAEWLMDDELHFGEATYEFEDSTNQYYGLQNINDSWLALFNTTTKEVIYAILSRRLTGLEITADEDENITKVKMMCQTSGGTGKGLLIYLGELTHGDLTRDSNGDGVPDFLSESQPTVEVDAIEIYDDDETVWVTWGLGSGSYALTASEETTEKKKGTSSLKMVIEAGTYSTVGIDQNFSPAQDWSNQEFLCVWLYGANTGLTVRFEINAPDEANQRRWDITDNFSGWKRFVFALNNPTSDTGNPDLTNITKLRLAYLNVNTTFTSYLDRTVIDVGKRTGIPWIVKKLHYPAYP